MSAQSGLNWLYYGDNLEIMRDHVASASVDLVYLDPPFNSSRAYNVIFARQDRSDDDTAAQIRAFNDTWHWTPVTDGQYQRCLETTPAPVGEALEAFHGLLGENDAMAYLVNMAPRLVQFRRVLRSTGSLYLHCDPTMSHYLKILLDAVFGAQNFRNEITWQRAGAKNDPLRYGRSHDVILFYSAGGTFTWNVQYQPFRDASIEKNYTHTEAGTGRRYRRGDLTAAKPGGDVDFEWHGMRPYKGRHWAYSREKLDQMLAEGRIEFRRTGMPVYKRYLDEQPGVPLQDVWTDVRLTSADRERLGYQTQKPRKLLERIISASTNAGDRVLDPFCGCGTTIDAAQRLGRSWTGIDVAFIAVDLIRHRLRGNYPDIDGTYNTWGIPHDLPGAHHMFSRSPFDFERWAVTLLGGQPNEKQRGDKGVDGVVRFYLSKEARGRLLVSVKGGHDIGPQYVRDLLGAVETRRAQMGVLVTLEPPTRGMVDAAHHAGTYTWPITNRVYPRIQIATVRELLDGKKPDMPASLQPYPQVYRLAAKSGQMTFEGLAESG